MKSISDNLLMLVLAFVVGFSPIQGVFASVSECEMMDENMHSQMVAADKMDMEHSNHESDCCDKNECVKSHCANNFVVATALSDINNTTYQFSAVFLKPNTILLPFYSSSLYRPPKI